MNYLQRIAKNTIVLFLNQVIMTVLSLVFVAIIARKLGDTGYGKYSFAVAFTSIFIIFADLGLNDLAFRDIARDRTNSAKYLGNIITIKLILSIVTFFMMWFVINFIGYPFETRLVVYFIGVYMILTRFTQLFRFTFYAFEKMEYGVLITIMDKVLLMVIGVVILLLKPNIVLFSTSFIIAGIASWLLAFLICIRKFTVPKITIDLEFWRYLFKAGLPLGVMFFFIAAYQKINIMILSSYKGDAITGWYSASFNLFSQISIIATVIVTSIYPRLSHLAVSAEHSLRSMYQKSLRYLVILALPLMTGMIVLANKIIMLIYGTDFAKSVFSFQIIALAMVFSFCNILLWSVLITINKQKIAALNLGATLVFLIILDIILIPKWSYIGATIAQVASEIILFMMAFYFVSKNIGFAPIHKIIIRPVLASIGMGVFIYFFGEAPLLLIVPLGASLYFGLLYLIKGLLKEDVQLLKNIFTKNIPLEN